MFWNNNSLSSSHLETLLSKEDVTLQELMDEEEVLQECRSQNKRLIDYLGRAEVLAELVTLTTVEPAGDDYLKYKYPNIACELLTCEVPQIYERLANDEALLGKLYSFLESNAPLNPLLASFFSKIFSVLIGRTTQQNWYSYQLTCLKVLQFLKSKENCVALLLKHMGTSAIMDLLFKLITEVEANEMKQCILDWLDEQKLIQNVVALFDPNVDSDVHSNAAQLLCDVIRVARENRKLSSEQDRILDRIESSETVSLLLDQILKEPKCETSIIGGISVLLALLKGVKGETGDQFSTPISVVEDSTLEPVEPSEIVTSTIKAILPRLKDFHEILINPPVKPAVSTTIGLLDPPLGNTRVEVAKLLSVLVANNNIEVNQELAKLDTVNVLLDLFFKYTWNNFLHAQVEHCLACAFSVDITIAEGNETQNTFLIAHILVQCRLLQRILDAWEDNETQQNIHKRPRRGYMGHLIKIANTIAQNAGKGPLGALLTEIIDYETFSKWENFVATKLADVNEIYTTCLGGVHPQDVGEDSKLQETYSSYYQLQALASSYTEQFGAFQEEQFSYNEDMLNSSNDLILPKISFDIDYEDLDQQSSSFGDLCMQALPDLNDELAERMNEQLFQKMEGGLKRELSSLLGELDNYGYVKGDSPERSGPEGREENQNQFDSVSSWSNDGEKIAPLVEAVNPWDTTANANTSSSSPDLGWANFESAPFVADFSLNLTPDINTTIATSVPSSEIETISLDLTPSDNNLNMDDLFSKSISKLETAQVAENIPTTAVFTDIETITNAFEDIKMNVEENNRVHFHVEGDNTVFPGKEEAECDCTEDSVPDTISQRCSVQNEGSVGDINSSHLASDNFRFHSLQSLMTNCGQKNNIESESSGDGYKLLQENVQSVPNDSNQSSTKIVETVECCSPPVPTTNGPV